MIIVNPDNTNHTISVVPRFDVTPGSGELTMVLTDSYKNTSDTLVNTFDVSRGKLIITFDYTFRSEGRYDIAVTYLNTSEVLYRGAAIATNQDTQEYKLTNNKFYY